MSIPYRTCVVEAALGAKPALTPCGHRISDVKGRHYTKSWLRCHDKRVLSRLAEAVISKQHYLRC